MDDIAFDRIARLLGKTPTRRTAFGLFAGALGVLTTSHTGTGAKAKNKKKGKCPKKPCPAGHQRDKRTCKCECKRLQCSGGMEFDTKTCRCRCPRGMRECRDGCVGLDRCCPGDPPCPEDPKGCCHSPGLEVCTIDGCCAELDGIKACNDFCIDTNTNPHHCGDCNVSCEPGETCVNGECNSTTECPDGVSCPGRTDPHCAPADFSCCGDNACNAFHECCDPNEDRCCLKGRCVGGKCCAEGKEICGNQCCDFGKVCCGGECCSSFSCVNGACCASGACGAIDAAARICPADGEACCIDVDNSGYACPATDFGDPCATNGRCCPDGTDYQPSCGKCCSDIRQLCEECEPTFPGRTS